jgi:hypothetical protein
LYYALCLAVIPSLQLCNYVSQLNATLHAPTAAVLLAQCISWCLTALLIHCVLLLLLLLLLLLCKSEEADIISHSPIAGLLRPAYVILKDPASREVVLCVRGTHSRSDMFTSLTGRGWAASFTKLHILPCRRPVLWVWKTNIKSSC